MASFKGDNRLESFDEYDEPCEMKTVYCRQMTLEESEEQAINSTEQALLDLMSYMDKNPQAIQKLLQKRKKEDLGFFSFLKMKMLGIISGNEDGGLQVSEEECQEKIQKLKTDMTKVFDYSLKAKGRRCSSRLAAKRQMKNGVINDENNPALLGVPPPPPPPPLPPPALTTPSKTKNDLPRRAIRNTPLKDVNFQMDTPQSLLKVAKKRERRVSGESFSSLSTIGSFSSLQQELLSSNPLKRLRSTSSSRSPGGTPSKQQPGSKPTLSEPLYRAFANSIQQKFRNVRSPSPAAGTLYDNVTSPRSAALSPTGFTP